MSDNIQFDDAQLKKFIKTVSTNLPKVGATIVNQTTAEGLTKTKLTLLENKRSGELARSYSKKKIDRFSYLISSNLKRALTHEVGRKGKGRIIKPRNPNIKFLVLPFKKSLTNKDGSLKKLSKERINSEVKAGNLRFVKSVKMSDLKPHWVIRDKVAPYVRKRLEKNSLTQLERLMNGSV